MLLRNTVCTACVCPRTAAFRAGIPDEGQRLFTDREEFFFTRYRFLLLLKRVNKSSGSCSTPLATVFHGHWHLRISREKKGTCANTRRAAPACCRLFTVVRVLFRHPWEFLPDAALERIDGCRHFRLLLARAGAASELEAFPDDFGNEHLLVLGPAL